MNYAIPVQGVLSTTLFGKGQVPDNFNFKHIIDLPITDDKGEKIGRITDVDVERDIWIGVVYADSISKLLNGTSLNIGLKQDDEALKPITYGDIYEELRSKIGKKLAEQIEDYRPAGFIGFDQPYSIVVWFTDGSLMVYKSKRALKGDKS